MNVALQELGGGSNVSGGPGLRGDGWVERVRPREQGLGRLRRSQSGGRGSGGPQAGEPGRREGALTADRRGPGQAGPWGRAGGKELSLPDLG